MGKFVRVLRDDLHRVGSWLVAPSMALGLLRQELRDTETVQRLAERSERRAELASQIENALKAITVTQHLLRGLTGDRKAGATRWWRLTSVLKPLKARECGPENQWHLEIGVDPGPAGLELRIDREEFEGALYSLIENARQALCDQNRRVIQITVSYDPRGTYPLVIAVRDNGPGIAEAVRGRLYSRGETTKKNGRGLGLHLIREFMVQVDGQVTEDMKTRKETGSQRGTYTEFRLHFPTERVRSRRAADAADVQEKEWPKTSAC